MLPTYICISPGSISMEHGCFSTVPWHDAMIQCSMSFDHTIHVAVLKVVIELG